MDDVAAKIFGPQYAGRRYLRTSELIAIGIVGNRRTLANLVKRGDLPAPIRLGRLLLFPADAVAERLSENKGAPVAERPSDSNDPLAAGPTKQQHENALWVYPTPT